MAVSPKPIDATEKQIIVYGDQRPVGNKTDVVQGNPLETGKIFPLVPGVGHGKRGGTLFAKHQEIALSGCRVGDRLEGHSADRSHLAWDLKTTPLV